METTQKFVELSSLKWGVEDIDYNAERAHAFGLIEEDKLQKLLDLSEEDKLKVLEGVITSIQDYLMEQINDAIFSQLIQE